MRCLAWFTHLSVVHHVEHNGGDDAADGVGQHEDHHPLPAPQWDFGFTGWGGGVVRGQEGKTKGKKTVKVVDD